MNYRYYFGHHFKKQIKPYIKKYRSLWGDILYALNIFDPRLAVKLKHRIYKIRVKSRDIPKGKSHAFRMIVLLIEIDNILAPLTIYFKGDRENITQQEITYHTVIIENEISHLFP